MNTSQAQCEVIKATISARNATSSIVTALQSLLSADAKAKEVANSVTAISKAKAPAAKKPVRTTKKDVKPAEKAQPISIHEDEVRSLSPKERYALATEVVNITLKVLTETRKPRSGPGSDASSTPSTPKAAGRTPQRALQTLSGNETPAKATPQKPAAKASTPSAKASSGSATYLAATGECSRLAFSFLRSANTQKLGVRDLPALQLENGMIALSSKLFAHGLESLALKELRIVKHRLERADSPAKSGFTEKETLASLLRLEIDPEKQPQLLPLAISYQNLALQIIAISRKPASIESCADHLDLNFPSSPANIITRHGQSTGDAAKTGRMLESLSSTILSMCPSVNSSVDTSALKRELTPAPEAVLRLQVIALSIRKRWWKLVGHQADYEKELLDPFHRCLVAFVRRSAVNGEPLQIYNIAKAGAETVLHEVSSAGPKGLFSIRRRLCSLAENAGRFPDAASWADAMTEQCKTLDVGHAQRVAVVVRQASLAITNGEALPVVDDLASCLKANLAGSAGDYEYLLQELAVLLPRLSGTNRSATNSTATASTLPTAAATFAQRFTRSYPTRSLPQVQAIFHCALRQISTPEEAFPWIEPEAAKSFIGTGTLKATADAATTKPSERAWFTSSATLTLARILRLLAIKTIKTAADGSSSALFDDECLSRQERGLLLEVQLSTITEHASRPKYVATLKKLLPELLGRLGQIYTQSESPIRRASVAVTIIRLHETAPELLPPHPLAQWKNTTVDPENLGNDESLRCYAEDVNAALGAAKLFYQGQPSLEELRVYLGTWQGLIDSAKDLALLEATVYDIPGLAVSLNAIASFLDAIGASSTRLCVLVSLDKLNCLRNAEPNGLVASRVSLAMQWLSLGFCEKSSPHLAEASQSLENNGVQTLTKIQYHVAQAKCLLKTGEMKKSESELAICCGLRDALPPKAVSRDQRSSYERLHAEGWLLHSNLCLDSGSSHDALASAKHAVKILNSAWHRLEKGSAAETPSSESEDPEPKETDVNQLTTGVSKLRLFPAGTDGNTDKSNTKGAAFWPLIPLLCEALTHLSNMYAHHGLFSEANYYSTRAVEVGESVGPSALLSRVKSYRAILLSLAGKVDEAELVLAGVENVGLESEPLAAVERLLAQAAMRVKEGEVEEALGLYGRAEGLVAVNSTEGYLATLDGSGCRHAAVSQDANAVVEAVRSSKTAEAKPKRVVKTTTFRKAPALKSTGTKGSTKSIAEKSTVEAPTFVLLDQLKQKVRLEKSLIALEAGLPEGEAFASTSASENASSLQRTLLRRRHHEHHGIMAKAANNIDTDISYNILPESTLSFPALTPKQPTASLQGRAVAASRSTAKAAPRKTAVAAKQQDFSKLLQEARSCLIAGDDALVKHCTTAEIHSDGSLLSNVSILLSASGATALTPPLDPAQMGFTLDFPRINAQQSSMSAAAIDTRYDARSAPFSWPSSTPTPSSSPSPSSFQTEYINILPAPWTAISLTLSSDSTILYLTRYRANESPFILRLPFARNAPSDDSESQPFDFVAAKQELADIIQLSDYSCHNNSAVPSKNAKSSWWSEREALDRRLQELLLNIEEVWFGGFRGVLSPRKKQVGLLAKLRKSLSAVLSRHLPSRQSAKGKGKELQLDDHVLELFVNLGHDHDGVVDLDDAICELLYFVVDLLQFNGERNAYDEVDFDTMSVEVLDVLRTYHDGRDEEEGKEGHVVLVLDKRLQVFPWENLPCLEGVSVSRVGSLLSLRECVLAMRLEHGVADGRHRVERRSGAYFLNPSADLASTQATLQPALSKAASAAGADWRSFVKQAPTEDEFKATLEGSAITLYFGHGAGSQYIRPRAIKKLDACSEVVWLMGCSSGAVTEHGELEPQAVPLAYLMAGRKTPALPSPEDSAAPAPAKAEQNSRCFSILATLWDVTDKDIDRFSLAVGEDWGLWPSSSATESTKLAAKTPRKRERSAAPPSTPPQVPKTPKTPKAKKTPAAAKTPKRGSSRVRSGGVGLGEAVARSRDACYLRYLNGAAPVMYGVPVYLGD